MGRFDFIPVERDIPDEYSTANDNLFLWKPDTPYTTSMSVHDLERLQKFFQSEYKSELAHAVAHTHTENQTVQQETEEESQDREKRISQLRMEKSILQSMRESHLADIHETLEADEQTKSAFNARTDLFNAKLAELATAIEDLAHPSNTTESPRRLPPKSPEEIDSYYQPLLAFISNQALLKSKEEHPDNQQ